MSSWFDFVDHWGNSASVVGFGITIFGLILTYRKAKSAATSAGQAKLLAQNVIDRVTATLLISELNEAAHLVDSLDDACESCQWDLAVDRSKRLRKNLSMFIDNKSLEKSESEAIQGSVINLKLLEDDIKDMRRTRESEPKLSGSMVDKLIETGTILSRISGRLTNNVSEINSDKQQP